MAAVSQRLPEWSERLSSELDISDARARAVAEALTPAQLNWQARPGTWSIGQCLEHLAVGNEVYLAAIAASLSRNRPSGAVPEITVGAPSRWFIQRFIAASPEMKRAKAPGKIAPAPIVDASILDRFLRSSAAARDVIRRAAAFDVNRVRFRNPLLPVIRFTVGTGLEIVSKHEQRHLLQAERVRQAPSFPEAR